jgi:hypothetical protein
MGPWQGLSRGEIRHLRPHYRLQIAEQGFAVIYQHIGAFFAVTDPNGLTGSTSDFSDLAEQPLPATSDFLQLPCLFSPPFAIVFELKAYSVALIQLTNAGSFESGCMNEYVLATTIWINKTKSLRSVEELHGPVHHRLR